MNQENNKISCHSRGLLPGISALFPRPLRERVAEGRVRGFTLLEILVTVVIIAVLATIAVSAYQKAVVKSRFGSLMPLAKALTSANEEFYLRNGRYATNVSDLDVTSGGTTKAQITMGNESDHKYVLLTRDDMNNQLRMYQKHSPNFSGETHCEALVDNNLANWLCRDSLKGTLVGNKFGYTVYSLSEETVGSLARKYYNTNKLVLKDGDMCVATSSDGCSSTKASSEKEGCIADAARGCRGINFSDGATCTVEAGGRWGCDGTYDNATCVNKAGEGCSGTFTNYAKCINDCTGSSCYTTCRGTTFKDHAQCISNTNISGACDWYSRFENYSSCVANKGGARACTGSNFSDHSVCYGNSSGSCGRGFARENIFTGYSYCVGDESSTCGSSKYNDHSYCQANKLGSCTGNTYDSTSYCEGSYCPNGAPSNTTGKIWYRGTGADWPNTRASELVDKPTETE